jgi:glycosyltransferase involved in cell wall biosynthesis
MNLAAQSKAPFQNGEGARPSRAQQLPNRQAVDNRRKPSVARALLRTKTSALRDFKPRPGTLVLEPSPVVTVVKPKEVRKAVRQPLPATPLVSVVVLNYNGAAWLDRCLTSLAAQTVADDLEIIFADNASTDHSDLLAADLLKDHSNWLLVRHLQNLGCSGGYNEAARLARGQYLLFLNPDIWLEPDCLERLLDEVRATGATVATPLVMDYQDDTVQSAGESGFDPFGFLCGPANIESRTSDTKRFYANRNGLLVLLKNCRHLLLLLVPLQLCLLATEALVMGLLSRRFSHVRRAYWEAVLDCWRLRRHIFAERQRLKKLRHRGDFWMLRFLRVRMNRWREFRRFVRFGPPKVDPK